MDEVVKALKEFAKKNSKFFIATIIILLVILIILLPYIDSNFLFFNRINKRIGVLEKIVGLEIDTIDNNDILLQEYNSILSEIQNAQGNSIGEFTLKKDTPKDVLIKFISGGSLFWFVSLFVLFQKNKKGAGTIKHLLNNIMTFIMTALIGALFGWIAMQIPTLGNVKINAVLFPILLMILLGLIIYGSKKPENKIEN